MADSVADAAAAIRRGECAVYPTETVYGLGADATDPDAVERVYDRKGRSRDDPLSFAVPDVDAALDFVRPTPREEAFMREFLPGPVTVVVERRRDDAEDAGGDQLPDVLTAGRARVGVRVPDHAVALELLREAAPTPVTATSANVSGNPSVVRLADLDERIRDGAACVVDGGETPGAESTVVDPGEGVVHREGALAAEIGRWLQDNPA